MKKSPWSDCYQNTISKEPNETVIFAEKKFKDKTGKRALDIGSGTGCDSLYLLEQGFSVTALDQEDCALEILRIKTPKKFANKLTLVHAKIQNYTIADNSFDLINAAFSLPFCGKIDFLNVWEKIYKGLTPGGLFSGQLFGVNDDWSGIADMSFVTNEEVDDLIKGYSPEYYIEVDEDGRIADGSVKHWQFFNLVLKKL